MERCAGSIKKKYDISTGRFGLFFNFCINSPVFKELQFDVFTLPHSDAKNGALLVCVVMVYYFGNCEYLPC